ncbi:MAG: peptidase C11 [Lawsonibacter sp.]|jgi:hypothetical protein|nr:peptidase C11 [Lawsonibacter sp.]
MEHNRPRGRQKNVTGPGKSVQKRGGGLGTGPVGEAGGYQDRTPQSGGVRSSGGRRGGTKLIVLLLALLLGGGGGLTAFLGGLSGGQPQSPPTGQHQQPGQNAGSAGTDWTALLSGLGGGSVSSGWEAPANTGRLDATVASNAREKYTKLLGGGKDTVTLMVYMCGTDLESRSGMGTADLQEMLNARFGGKLNLLVYTGGCKDWKNNAVSSSTNQIWQVKEGRLVKIADKLGSVSMTDPSVLSQYIQWCAQKYPASRYGLILWDHGGGSVSGYGYDEKFASAGSMSLAGVDSALKAADVKFDFIGFDACLMATAETALTLTQHADYLIASEETEPGVGWYYTDWLTALGQNTSMPTIELGQQIVDSFVDTCAQKCRGQLTTLSVIDLAELEATLPPVLADFSRAATRLIQNKQYHTVSNARSGAREFAQSSQIDQVDLVHLAKNLGTKEGDALAQALLGAVKYNRTSSNMTNAYGLSIYFPYRKQSTVNKAVSTYQAIGMDDSYSQCIRQFADQQTIGAAGTQAQTTPIGALSGIFGTGNPGGDVEGISELLGLVLGSDFFSDRSLDMEESAQYVADHHLDDWEVQWQDSGKGDGSAVLRLSEEKWSLVHALELNVFYDDGEGFIDLGLDNVYEFDEDGALKGEYDGTWLAINGQPVAYYHMSTVDDGENYTITGRVPVLHNGQRSELILVFDDETPYGYVAGVQAIYKNGETDTVAKAQEALQPGDVLEFICDYYTLDGSSTQYQDSYLLGDPLTVTEEELTISNVPLVGSTRAAYRFTDLYGSHCWTGAIPTY